MDLDLTDLLDNADALIERKKEERDLTPLQQFATALTTDFLADDYYPMEHYFKTLTTLEEFREPHKLGKLIEEVNDILKRRGLPQFTGSKHTLDPRFVAACNLMLDVLDKRSQTAKLKDVGLDSLTWKNLLLIPENAEYFDTLLDRMLDQDMFRAGKLALSRNVADGELASIKYAFEMTGKYKSTTEFDPRVIVTILSAVLDIISANVDTAVAAKIADEIDKVAMKSLQSGVIDV